MTTMQRCGIISGMTTYQEVADGLINEIGPELIRTATIDKLTAEMASELAALCEVTGLAPEDPITAFLTGIVWCLGSSKREQELAMVSIGVLKGTKR